MSKERLIKQMEEAYTKPHTWNLYFFKIDRRSKNPYIVHKIRFRHSSALLAYAKEVSKMVGKYQIEKLEKVQEYTGENSKVACDKITLNNELIKAQWEYLFQDITEASEQPISGKYNGYILTGIPQDDRKPSVTMIKMANPIVEMQKQKSIIFNFTENDELDMVADDVCRLYMDTDIIIIDDELYAFNLKVETLFNMEQTMKKIKDNSITQLLAANAFSDKTAFVNYAKAYTSPRTFVTLNLERMKRLGTKGTRKKVAEVLGLEIDSKGKICLKDKEEASLLIRYICFKIFKDDETKGLLEASNVTKVDRK